jgi:hypothetical protein
MKRGFRLPGLGLRVGTVAAVTLAGAMAQAQEPPRTPTPAPRLSGGFGRPRATPVASPKPDSGQNFSDVVHAAHESRDAAGAGAEGGTLTINNRSLVKNPSKGKVSSSKPVPTAARPAPATPPAAVSQTTKDAAAADAASTGATEAQWRQTAAKARKQVADAKARVAELEAATRKLENDFYAWDDGQYRDRVIKPSWDRSKGELAAAKSALVEAEKSLADLPEKARQAGAMPGWIRE